MDWVLALPEELELKCKEAIAILEEELHVDYITSFERRGIEKGLQQGMQQGEGTMLLCFLEGKFKNVPDDYLKKINEADAETLVKWGKRVLDVNSLEDVFKD